MRSLLIWKTMETNVPPSTDVTGDGGCELRQIYAGPPEGSVPASMTAAGRA